GLGMARARGACVRGGQHGRGRARAAHVRGGGMALVDRVFRRRCGRAAPWCGRRRAAAHDDAHDAARRADRARAAALVCHARPCRARDRADAERGSAARRCRHAGRRRGCVSRRGSLVRGATAAHASGAVGGGGAVTLDITWRRVLAVIGAGAALGLLVAWSGVVNIGASTGHAAITDWFLHWAMRNTVRTYAALTVDELTLADDVVSAAGHYAATCAVCHGAPGEPPSPVMAEMTPPAPDLVVTVPTWSDEQLFWIIKHGVKFTAMPAWPALDRDDEIARMTAFVRRLPSLEPAEYRALAYGDGRIAGGVVADLDGAIADCDRCHADDGREQPDIPVLA